MKRRKFIAASASVFVLAHVKGHARSWYDGADAHTMASERVQLRMPATWDGISPLTIERSTIELWPTVLTDVITVGSYPGLTIDTRRGSSISVQVKNRLGEPTAVHWHGLDVPADMDGHPGDTFADGADKTYSFEVLNRAGMYFYHSHAHESTAKQVFNGLYGLFRVRDDEEDALGLPSGEFEIPMVIQDVILDSGRQLDYSPNMVDRMEGYLGNVMLVNGTPDSFIPVKRGTYRLRIVNASNARWYKLAFADERQMTVIGNDGGLIEHPVKLSSIEMAPSERFDILVDFSDVAIGTSTEFITLSFNVPPGHMGNPPYPQGVQHTISRFDIIEGEASTYNPPDRLCTIEPVNLQQATRTRVFDFEMLPTPLMPHAINGKVYEMHRIDEQVRLGDLEIWEFNNKDFDVMHPVHIHGGQFQLISRDGSTDIPAWEKGWKDTFIIRPNKKIQLAVRFNNYTGVFVLHCHILEHEDDGMMINYEVTPVTGVEAEGSGRGRGIGTGRTELWYSPATDAIVIQRDEELVQDVLTVRDAQGKTLFTSVVSVKASEALHVSALALPSGVHFATLAGATYNLLVVR